MLICSALVLLMTPGLAFFYGGLVRRKNVVNTMMTSVFVIGIAAIMWALFDTHWLLEMITLESLEISAG